MKGNWVALVLAVVLFECLGYGVQALFTPPDNYLIACGSSTNVTFQGRTFVPDTGHSSLSLKSGNSFVASSNSSAPAPIYQSARIFSGIASYKFNIKQEGRHWVRLYFYPLAKSGQDLTSAPITVVTDDFVLLNNFTFKNFNGSFLFKEYAINVTSDTLTLTFIPSNNSVSFVNAIEVVSIPDAVLPDQALALNPSTPFSGLSEFALETVYRLNMGGPLITAQNDTLGRTWENDVKYLHVNSSALNVSVSPASIKYRPSISSETAPNWVYASAEAMGDANVPTMNFNITWVFPVDTNFRYLVRAHFCDILSQSLNTLVFNVYINDDIALASLDLSSLTGDLNVPYYKDFISNSSAESDALTVSVGPDSMADLTNATMNGLEILKISNDAGSLDGLSSVKNLLPQSSSKKNKIGIIIGCIVGAVAAVVLIGFCYCCLVARKSKTTHQGHPWLPLPLYGNSQTMTKMSTTSQKSGTASCISLASSNLALDQTHVSTAVKGSFGYLDPEYFRRQQLTEKSDVYSFGVVLMEVLCTRPALNPVLPREQVNIAEWAMTWQKKGMLDQIMDSNLVGKVNPASLKKYGETAEKCLAEHGVDRPSMGDVLWNLEYALQLEETSSALMEPDDNSTNHIPAIQLTPLGPFDNSVSMIDAGNSGTDDDAEDAATSAVFSQLVNPRGR
ncbi:hypothetical protein COLO4_09464 [Corchorus olitorius]|uniref:Protein kinase domain-containing protein n=1 Tax=Corchorus olitorius TaxID=93759 RepID=A0A1R3KBV8_9ROSI|nr:hypothetical protein COLO4_09464 [Corchorus olitorius]